MKIHELLLLALLPLAACTGPGKDTDTGDTELIDTDIVDETDVDETDVAGETDVEETDVEETDVEETDVETDEPTGDDLDGDGYTVADGDCDDDPVTGPNINPGATEIASDGIDQDCNGLVATVDVSCHDIDNDGTVGADPITSVRMVGPWWSWDPVGGPVATDNGDGTWTVLFEDAPAENMEYLWGINEGSPYENLIDDAAAGGSCAPITDSATYANRQWMVGSGDVTDTLSRCGACP